jgi:hypothetical protein
MNIHKWQCRNDDARAADQQVLNERLRHLEKNQKRLVKTLGTYYERVTEQIEWNSEQIFTKEI